LCIPRQQNVFAVELVVVVVLEVVEEVLVRVVRASLVVLGSI
jgi:hypothetical protein